MPNRTATPPFRADHVGSLLRSKRLIEAHQAFLAGNLPAEALHALEDEEIRNAVAMQERVGLHAVADGELRRNNWRDRFFERVEGFSRERLHFHRVFRRAASRHADPCGGGELRRRQAMTARDFAFLQPLTQETAKATLPSPSVNHFFSGDKSLVASPYRDRRAFLADVTAICREEIADLAAAGCRGGPLYRPVAALPQPAMRFRLGLPNRSFLLDDQERKLAHLVGIARDLGRGVSRRKAMQHSTEAS
jgi:5-methyltetrahydropteroyltriglutamate--homocysteine methyltransferase